MFILLHYLINSVIVWTYHFHIYDPGNVFQVFWSQNP
jgi:hypothetical protein